MPYSVKGSGTLLNPCVCMYLRIFTAVYKLNVFPAPHFVSCLIEVAIEHSPSVTPTTSTPLVIQRVGGDSYTLMDSIGLAVV